MLWVTYNALLENKLITVKTVKCCKSLQLKFGFASKAKAKTPAASGAAAEVPECERVQRPYKSVVATPLSGFLPPLEKVEAKVEEQLLKGILEKFPIISKNPTHHNVHFLHYL